MQLLPDPKMTFSDKIAAKILHQAVKSVKTNFGSAHFDWLNRLKMNFCRFK